MIPVPLAVVAVVFAVIVTLFIRLRVWHLRDARMVKAQEAFQARRLKEARCGAMSPLDRAQWLQQMEDSADSAEYIKAHGEMKRLDHERD